MKEEEVFAKRYENLELRVRKLESVLIELLPQIEGGEEIAPRVLNELRTASVEECTGLIAGRRDH